MNVAVIRLENETVMPLQFYSIEAGALQTLDGSVSDLATCSHESLLISEESMVAFAVIRHAAAEPATLQNNEVSSIDKLIYGGVALYSPANDSFVHHLSQELVVDAMIDFARFAPDTFIEMVGEYVTYGLNLVLGDESPEQILHEYSALAADSPTISDSCQQTELSIDDILGGWHWAAISELKGFVGNSLKNKLELVRYTAE